MSQYDTLIRGAHVFAPQDLGIVDLGILDGKVAAIGIDLPLDADEIVEGHEQVVMPGAIETHAHMLLPFGGTQTMNNFYDGTLAAAFGGVTTLIDFADQVPGGRALDAFERRMEQAAGQCVIDYGFHSTLTDITDETLEEIPGLIARGVTSFKFYSIYEGLGISYDDMQRAFEKVAACGALATVHAEDDARIAAATEKLIAQGKTSPKYFVESEPEEAEAYAISKVIELSEKTGAAALIRHVSSAVGARLIQKAQRKGHKVYGETCPHYLTLTKEAYEGPHGGDYIVHPPIRSAADQAALWATLEEGTVFTTGTDDCAFYLHQKRVSERFYEIPGGFPGIETRVPILYEQMVAKKRLEMEQFVRLVSTTPAQLYGLYPRKGALAVGSDADLVLFAPGASVRISAADLHEKSDYTPFEGFETSLRVCRTMVRGKTIVKDGERVAVPGYGTWLTRSLPTCPDGRITHA